MFCPASDPSPQVARAGVAPASVNPVEMAAASTARSCGWNRGAAAGDGRKAALNRCTTTHSATPITMGARMERRAATTAIVQFGADRLVDQGGPSWQGLEPQS
mmetsp:Transcript_35396/g.82605  ORF Transcript_35396/g.82605 Transcript_35396/m.82605 type:complete len:103 (-) Transcript_35396:7-315(-)